jgi:hypothetical protein
MKLEADQGYGSLHRVRRRLGKWQIVAPRFRDCPALRAAPAVIEYQELKARQMIP